MPTLLILLVGWPVVALVVALARRAKARRLAAGHREEVTPGA